MCRQNLLQEVVTKLCQCTVDTINNKTCVTVTGVGGFGKTSIVTAVCHHPVIKETFTDGFVFINLGPQCIDPNMKLSHVYHLLTNQYFKDNIFFISQKINKFTSEYCRNLLVIIDDVWHVEDAEPIVKAFSNCKIVLTTRMNDIEQYIPTKQVVSVGPMEQSEAISLLTCGVIDISQLSQEDVNLLDKLTQDVHQWPLLLSLIRGQLYHKLSQLKMSTCAAISHVQAKLCDKGLTAFDRSDVKGSCKKAVKACLEETFELLTKPLSDKMKSLLLYIGIGESLQKAVLHTLWNVTQNEASDTVSKLYSYGLVQLSDITIPPHNNKQCCIVVHAVIGQCIMEAMDSNTTHHLSAYGKLGTAQLVDDALKDQFMKSYGIQSLELLSATDYLKYKIYQMEYYVLPHHLKQVNLLIINDPHYIISYLQDLQNAVNKLPNITMFTAFLNQVKMLISDCHKILRDAHILSQQLNLNLEKCLRKKDYDCLIQLLEQYIKSYPVFEVAQEAVNVINKAIPYCDGELLLVFEKNCKRLCKMKSDYHVVNLLLLPFIKLHMQNLLQKITSLQKGSPDIEIACHYYKSEKIIKEEAVVMIDNLIKLSAVDPNWVYLEIQDKHSPYFKYLNAH